VRSSLRDEPSGQQRTCARERQSPHRLSDVPTTERVKVSKNTIQKVYNGKRFNGFLFLDHICI
jgi:hypothetical protein